MRVSTRRQGTTAVLGVEGRLTIESSAEPLLEKVRYLRSRGVDCFVVDLSGVNPVDCSGIGELVRLYVEIQATGARLRLCSVRRKPECLLDLFGLSRVLGTCGSEQEAVASFARRRSGDLFATVKTRASFQDQIPRRRIARARIDSRGRIAAQARVAP